MTEFSIRAPLPATLSAALRPGRRAAIASRTLAAILGGYALASATAVAMAVALPLARADAVLVGMMLGIVLITAAAIWAFAVRTALRAWAGILGLTLALTALAFALRPQQVLMLLP